jgi:hypothetical protein
MKEMQIKTTPRFHFTLAGRIATIKKKSPPTNFGKAGGALIRIWLECNVSLLAYTMWFHSNHYGKSMEAS